MLFHNKGFKRHFAVVSFFHVTNRCSIFKMWIYLSSFADFTPCHCREIQISGQYQLRRLTLQHCGIKIILDFLKFHTSCVLNQKFIQLTFNIYNNWIFLFLFFKFVICLLLIRNRNVLHSNNATFAYTSSVSSSRHFSKIWNFEFWKKNCSCPNKAKDKMLLSYLLKLCYDY